MIDLIKEDNVIGEEPLDYTKFVVNPRDINKDINDFFTGKIKKGYMLGIDAMDKHMVLKDNTFYASTGRKGRGKTTITNLFQKIKTGA